MFERGTLSLPGGSERMIGGEYTVLMFLFAKKCAESVMLGCSTFV
jgi:hypothetical protein